MLFPDAQTAVDAAAGETPVHAEGYDLTDPDLAPLVSDRLGTLPPTYVATAEHDPARDEGERLAGLVAASGVEVVATRWLGQSHGFWRHDQAYAAAEPLMLSVAAFLRTH